MRIKFHKVNKIYRINKSREFYALKDVSFTLPKTGLISLVGKSGCGKSTIINLIAGIDTPTSGEIYLDNLPISYYKQRNKDFYGEKIGILFQSYNLLEEESAIENVLIPLLIHGVKKSKASKETKAILKEVSIDDEFFDKKVSLLSGGEKQRVALARTISTSPEVLLCDEPTGALDENNSHQVMKILKRFSENHLVIMASHNLLLVNEYSDAIIYIKDGKIDSFSGDNEQINSYERKIGFKKKSNFIFSVVKHNIKKRFKRDIFEILSLTISLTFLLLVLSFMNGKKASIDNACYGQFDYGVGVLSKEEKISNGSFVSLSKSYRPDLDELINNKQISDNFYIEPNLSAFFSDNLSIYYDEEEILGMSFNPVYSFEKMDNEKSLLIEGKMSAFDNIEEIVINQKTKRFLDDKYHKDMLGESLTIRGDFKHTYIDQNETIIEDYLEYDFPLKIVGVVDEFDYLLNEKIYYSYKAYLEYFKNTLLENLSTYFYRYISVYDRILECDNNSYLSGYSYYLFLKESSNKYLLDNKTLFLGYTYNNNALLKKETLLGFMETAEYGVTFFLIITFLGTILIFGITSLTSFSEERKRSAILLTIGASRKDIIGIYLLENCLLSNASHVFSIFLAIILSKIINAFIFQKLGVYNLLLFPFSIFGVVGLPILLGFVIVSALSALITLVPILFTKRISLKEELQSL